MNYCNERNEDISDEGDDLIARLDKLREGLLPLTEVEKKIKNRHRYNYIHIFLFILSKCVFYIYLMFALLFPVEINEKIMIFFHLFLIDVASHNIHRFTCDLNFVDIKLFQLIKS